MLYNEEQRICPKCDEPMKHDKISRAEEWYCDNKNCPEPSDEAVERRRRINRRTQSRRQKLLDAMAEEMGWDGISEYLTSIIRGQNEIPQK
jgi:hypothetical protein